MTSQRKLEMIAAGKEMDDQHAQKLRAIVTELDPMGLRAMGAPEGEYSHEIMMLAGSEYRIRSALTAARCLWEIFEYTFSGVHKHHPGYYAAAGRQVYQAFRDYDDALAKLIGMPTHELRRIAKRI